MLDHKVFPRTPHHPIALSVVFLLLSSALYLQENMKSLTAQRVCLPVNRTHAHAHTHVPDPSPGYHQTPLSGPLTTLSSHTHECIVPAGEGIAEMLPTPISVCSECVEEVRKRGRLSNPVFIPFNMRLVQMADQRKVGGTRMRSALSVAVTQRTPAGFTVNSVHSCLLDPLGRAQRFHSQKSFSNSFRPWLWFIHAGETARS